MSGLAREYIAYARQLSTNGCFSKAVDLYSMAFEKNPQIKPLFEFEFRANVMKLNEVLAAANKIEDIFTNFGRALGIFPGNVFFFNEIGKYLYKYGYYEEAWNQFQKALEGDAGYVNAEKNLNSMKNLLVERWHFRMLNDKIRNQGYQAALHEMIEPNETTVLDLGTGTGLLAMYATENNPSSITACDGSEVMTTLTDCVLEDNRLLMSIVVVNKMSTSMDIFDVGGIRSLLVTELFDAGLFGEHILQSLSHAWNNLLSNTAQVIPHSAEFFVLGARSDLLTAKYQLCSKTKSLLNIPNHNVHILSGDETYDCEDVHLYKDIKYLTGAMSVVKVDFTDLEDIQEKLNHTEPYTVELKVLESGEFNTLIGWFNLYLTTNITITTDPRIKNRANAWQQAVFFDTLPKNLQENETLSMSFFMNSGKITKQLDCSSHITRISADTLRFLNDDGYLKMIKSCIGMVYLYLGQMTEVADIYVADLCPFPFFGFLMLKRGIKSLTCFAKNEYDKAFINEVFSANDIDMSKVTFLPGDEWTQDSFGEEKFHAIFCNIFELCGDIDVHQKEIAEFLKNTRLVQGGLFLPSTITLMGQIVSSNWLNINNRVYDENLGYKVSRHINKYQVSQNFCLDFTNLEYTPLSDPIVLGNYSHITSDVVNVAIKNDGDANAILCWYNIELIESLEEISTRRPYSFIDGIAFLANPIIPMVRGNTANILRCVDPDGSFKLMIDIETT